MKKLISLCSGIMFSLTVNAQFCVTNLPGVYGDYNISFFSTNNVNVPAMLALTTNSGPTLPGEGATWDFSVKRQSDETTLRTDIIAPSNGMDGADFPDATYSEQDTAETLTYTNQIGWRYYSITNQGRWYYGFFVPNTGADGLAVFQPPNVDIPATVTNGQTWSRSTSWNTLISGYFSITYEFSDTAVVDAQGTLILPNLGPFPALRVHEVQDDTGLHDGSLYISETNQYYYWLVPHLGVAAQITLYGNTTVEGVFVSPPPFTNSVQRMYYDNYYTPPPGPSLPVAANLFIHLQGGAVALNWLQFTNPINNLVSIGYQVQALSSLSGANWQVLGLTSNTNWSDALSSTQRFYRVVGSP